MNRPFLPEQTRGYLHARAELALYHSNHANNDWTGRYVRCCAHRSDHSAAPPLLRHFLILWLEDIPVLLWSTRYVPRTQPQAFLTRTPQLHSPKLPIPLTSEP
jgi:hypothetical protein